MEEQKLFFVPLLTLLFIMFLKTVLFFGGGANEKFNEGPRKPGNTKKKNYLCMIPNFSVIFNIL